jgi:hypothetical protein
VVLVALFSEHRLSDPMPARPAARAVDVEETVSPAVEPVAG